MSGALICAYAVGGGIPPATYEALRVHADGTARAVVGNAWPFGAPQDEAGSYEQRLDSAELTALARAVADAPAAPSTPSTADAGRCELQLGDDRRILWPMSSRPPDALVPLVERLRELLAATRRHPVGAIAVGLEPPAAATAGDAFGLGLVLHNPGAEPVGLDGGQVRVRATTADGGGAPDLESLVAAEPLDVALPAELGAGERRTILGPLAITAPGRWRLDVLARLDADLPYEGERLRLECVALAGPAVVRVG